MSTPKISVIMATYNHAPYVGAAIESVLSQKDVDFEFLIEDDGSRDHTRDVVNSYQDPRIQFYPREENLGACTTLNNLVQRCKGEYIALINSDDSWFGTDKLAYQARILDAEPTLGACFGRARYIDADGGVLDKQTLPYGRIFDEPNHHQAGWLRRFFFLGNCLCHPTMLIRKVCYEKVGLYNNRLRQVPDLDMWMRLIKQFNIHVAEREMISFRLRADENTSAPTSLNSTRLLNEYFLIYQTALDDVPATLFREAFSDHMTFPDLPTPEHQKIEAMMQYLQPGIWLEGILRMIGLQKMFSLLNQTPCRSILKSDYGIDDKWFQEQMAVFSPFIPQTVYVEKEHPPAPPAIKQPSNFPLLRYLRLFGR